MNEYMNLIIINECKHSTCHRYFDHIAGSNCSKIRLLNDKVIENICPKSNTHYKVSLFINIQLIRCPGEIIHNIHHGTWRQRWWIDKCLCNSISQTTQMLKCNTYIKVSRICPVLLLVSQTKPPKA